MQRIRTQNACLQNSARSLCPVFWVFGKSSGWRIMDGGSVNHCGITAGAFRAERKTWHDSAIAHHDAISGYRSRHFGLRSSISWIFHARRHFLSCFSRVPLHVLARHLDARVRGHDDHPSNAHSIS